MSADEKLRRAEAERAHADRVLVHKHVWIKDGPMSPESLALLVSEGWTVWRAVPSGYPPRSRYHFYDLVRDITDA